MPDLYHGRSSKGNMLDGRFLLKVGTGGNLAGKIDDTS